MVGLDDFVTAYSVAKKLYNMYNSNVEKNNEIRKKIRKAFEDSFSVMAKEVWGGEYDSDALEQKIWNMGNKELLVFNLTREGLIEIICEVCGDTVNEAIQGKDVLGIFAIWGSSHIIDITNERMNAREHVKKLVMRGDDLCLSPTLIKMDIEGSELKALEGLKSTIQRCNPKLAICIYHKPEDLWEIPLLLKSNNDKYKIDVRHHSYTDTETVCYARIK